MKNVYALLVGIADYPPIVNRLYGCKNDVEDMDLLFKEIFTPQNRYRYQPRILLNNEAKRRAIVEGFGLFDQAGGQDVCIFYYSGHGSLVKTNASFWTDGSGQLQSLVCYDSRFPSGYDLVDKELAYLIWKATRNKPAMHFLSIMDCCFAGSNTRSVAEINRMFNENENVKPLEEFEGYETYTNNVPPRGRYIALSASRPKEPSKEKMIDGMYRGVFTYFLTHAIRQAGGSVDYQTLIDQVTVHTALSVQSQVPQLEAFLTQESTGLFGQAAMPAIKAYSLFYDARWKISKGSLNGIKTGDQLRLEDGTDVTVTATGINDSEVTVGGAPDPARVYSVFPKRKIAVMLRYYMASGPGALSNQLRGEMAGGNYEGIDLDGDEGNADYFIEGSLPGKLFITEPGSQFPLFERIGADRPDLFLRRLEHVAKWASIVQLFNADGLDLVKNMAVELYRLDKNGQVDDALPATKVEDISQECKLTYTFESGQPQYPAFRLTIRNNHGSDVYTCLLYCSSEFGVTDMLLPNSLLEKGKEVKAAYSDEGKLGQTVPLYMDPLYYQSGKKQIREYILLIISELSINSASFNLDPLPLDNPGARSILSKAVKTGSANKPDTKKPVWGTIKIPLVIDYPK